MFCCASKEASLYRAGRWTGHVSGYVLLCTPLATLPAISGSYSGLLPWSAGLCWLLLRSTCEIFACYPTSGTRGRSSRNSTERGRYSVSMLLVIPQGRPLHYLWLAPLCGIGFNWHRDYSP